MSELRIPSKAKCPECGRVFDLMDEDDAGEWYYGHDCESKGDPFAGLDVPFTDQ